MKRTVQRGVACATILFPILASCSSGDPEIIVDPADDFVVLQVKPKNNTTAYLNDTVAIDFSLPVDADTVDLNSVSFQVFDALGEPSTEHVLGTFRLDRWPGDAEIGRRLVFEPSLPTDNDYGNGGFKPGRTYLVRIAADEIFGADGLFRVAGQKCRAYVRDRFRL